MSEFVQSGAYLVSTDSVIIPEAASLDCGALAEMRSAGSDMEKKIDGDAVWIGRTRLYAVLQRVERLRVADQREVLAQDETWAVVKVARQGIAVRKEDAAQWVLESLRRGCDADIKFQTERVMSAESALRLGVEIGDEQVVERMPRLRWDGKRRLLFREVNPWRSFSATAPYETAVRLEEAENRKVIVRHRNRARERDLARKKYARVLECLAHGELSVSEIAVEVGVSRAAVRRLRMRLRQRELDDLRRLAPLASWDSGRAVGDEKGTDSKIVDVKTVERRQGDETGDDGLKSGGDETADHGSKSEGEEDGERRDK
jgi:hypothetical protein